MGQSPDLRCGWRRRREGGGPVGQDMAATILAEAMEKRARADALQKLENGDALSKETRRLSHLWRKHTSKCGAARS